MTIRNYAVSLLALGAFSLAAPANAADMDVFAAPPSWGWYIEAQGGTWLGEAPEHTLAGIGKDRYLPDHVFTFMGAAGVHVSPNVRAELNVTWTSGGDGEYLGLTHDGSFDAYTIVANGIYVLDPVGMVQLFVGAGAGIAIVDVDNIGAVGGGFTTDDSDTAFVVNGLVGVDIPVSDMVTLTTRYTFGWMDSMNFDTTAAGLTSKQDDAFFHAITAGIRLSLY